MATLPAPRVWLTSLINAISAIPLEDQPAASEVDAFDRTAASGGSKSSPSVLRLVPIEHRHLFITLHVIFPLVVLPALDLLDRGLVTKLSLELKPETTRPQGRGPSGPGASEQSPGDGDAPESTRPSAHAGFFLVRSAQSTHPRRRFARSKESAAAGSAQTFYVVRLDSWNCTCAAFAFSAFPAVPAVGAGHAVSGPVDGTGPVAHERQDPRVREGDSRKGTTGQSSHGQQVQDDWSFGGMSLDGIDRKLGDSENVPLCKHLLACLLAERWKGALSRYVMERMVRKEEMAGLVADI